MNKDRVEKELLVTIMVDVDGHVRFDFRDNNNGECSCLCLNLFDPEFESRVGAELTAWATSDLEGDEYDDDFFAEPDMKIYGTATPWNAPGMKLSDFF